MYTRQGQACTFSCTETYLKTKNLVIVHNHYSARCFQNEKPSFGRRQKQYIALVCIICDCEEHGSEQLQNLLKITDDLQDTI